MTDPEVHDHSKVKKSPILVVVAAIAALLVAVAAFLAWFAASGDGSGQQEPPADTTSADSSNDGSPNVAEPTTPQPVGGGEVLAEAMSGQAAIDALGVRIDQVAEQNGLTVDELKELLLQDASAHVSPTGRILYLDTGLTQAAE